MDKESNFIIFTDGGARGNPGPAAYGFVVYDKDMKLLYEEGKSIGIQTNNVAEYSAVVAALKYLLSNIKNLTSNIQFFMDSKLVAEQMSERWKIKNENLRGLYFTIKQLEREIKGTVTYQHVRREKNIEADRMVNLALDGEI